MPRFKGYHLVLAVLVILVFSLGACGTTPTPTPTAAVSGNPLDVSTSLDTGKAATQVIGSAGGSLRATAADGTSFTLEVPQDALADETTIILTPLTSISGLPFKNGLAGAVQLGPDGLQLLEPATLTIELAHPIPVVQQVGFGYFGDGRDFHLAPLNPRTSKIQLYIRHFSGNGVGNGSPSDAASITPASPEARLSQQIAEALIVERQAVLDAIKQGLEPPDMSDATKELIQDAMDEYKKYLNEQMKAAETNCALATQVVPEAISLDRQMQLLGVANPDENTLFGLSFTKAMDNCEKEAEEEIYKACAGDDLKAVEIATARVLGFERQRALLGMEPGVDLDQFVEKAFDKCEKEAVDELDLACAGGDLEAIRIATARASGIDRQRSLLGMGPWVDLQSILDRCGPPKLSGYITDSYTENYLKGIVSNSIQVKIQFPGGQGEWMGGQGAWTAGQGTWKATEGTWTGSVDASAAVGYGTGCAGYSFSASGGGAAVLIVVGPNNPPFNPSSLLDQGTAVVTVTFMEDGPYYIQCRTPPLVATVHSYEKDVPECEATNLSTPDTSELSIPLGCGMEGWVDPKNVRRISGEKTTVSDDIYDRRRTTTWSIGEDK